MTESAWGKKSRGWGWLLVLVLALGASGCGSDGPADATETADCSVRGQVDFVRTALRDHYLWYRELPDPDPASFRSPDDYLEAVRYRRFDETFSFIAPKAASDAFFSESEIVTYGFEMVRTSVTDLHLSQVYPGSSAAEAGMRRGSRLVAINGKLVSQLLANPEQIFTELGNDVVGVSAQIRFAERGGAERDVRLVKRAIAIPTVSKLATIRVGSRNVGYLAYDNFVRPSIRTLDTAFAQLRADGVRELILDVRYNGGGLVDVAQHLGGLLGGSRTAGQPLVRFVHNDKNTARDIVVPFPASPQALDLTQLVVITSFQSASASELIIHGLRPFMNVTVVGDDTYGKPVGQSGREFCEKYLYAVEFVGRNARNDPDYFGGIPADCPAFDDLRFEQGDPREDSLAVALDLVESGRCNPTRVSSAVEAHRLGRTPKYRPLSRGWRDHLAVR